MDALIGPPHRSGRGGLDSIQKWAMQDFTLWNVMLRCNNWQERLCRTCRIAPHRAFGWNCRRVNLHLGDCVAVLRERVGHQAYFLDRGHDLTEADGSNDDKVNVH